MSASRVAATGGPSIQDEQSPPDRGLSLLLLLITSGVAALHFTVVFLASVNFDEFRFLADIYEYQRGTLRSPLQTLHVHLFQWLPGAGLNEIDEITAARIVYYVALLASSGCAYLIARRFFTQSAGLFVVLCHLSYAEVIFQGAAFRFDGLSAVLLLAALAIVVQRGTRRLTIGVAGLLTAVALLVTIKSVFYLPTLTAAVLLRSSSIQWKTRACDLVIFGAAVCVALAVLLTLHMHALSAADMESAAGVAMRSREKVLRLDVLFPARQYMLWTLLLNPVLWLFVALGVAGILRRLRQGQCVTDMLLLLALLLPLGSLVLYRNAFPYFYAFIMPAVLVVSGMRFDQATRQLATRPTTGAHLFLGVMIVGAVTNFGTNYARFAPFSKPTAQRQVIEAVHRMFPQPVYYIDAYSMIASFPKAGFFMSTWGVDAYRDAGVPIFEELLLTKGPVLLIANDPALSLEHTAFSSNGLLAEDIHVLRNNFVPHWGPIHVLGKQLLVAAGGTTEFEVLVSGPYTIETLGTVWIDGIERRDGNVVELSRGRHYISAGADTRQVVLRWGSNLYRPLDVPPALPGFWAKARQGREL